MEIIDWIEYHNKEDDGNLLSWFLLESMSKAGIENFKDFDSHKIQIEIIDVPVVSIFEYIQKQIEVYKLNAVNDAYDKMFNDLNNEIDNILCRSKNSLKDEIFISLKNKMENKHDI